MDEPIEISGDYDTFTGQNLMIVYEICNPKLRKCKSAEVIQQELETSYMLIIENEQVFKHWEYPGSKEMIERVATYRWYALS